MKTIEDISLKDLLPQGIGADAAVQAAAQSIDPHLQAIGRTTDGAAVYANIGTLTHEMLDALAVQFDATNWKDSWTRDTKISVLKTIIANKRKVGTLKAVREAIESFGNKAQIVEWFNDTPQGEPHTFKIYLLYGGNDVDVSSDIISAVNLAKPARSHFAFVIRESGTFSVEIGAMARPISVVRCIATVNLED